MDPDQLGNVFRFVGGRSLVGRLAVLHGYLKEEQLQSALHGDSRPPGPVLVEAGLLSAAQLAELQREEAEIQRGDRGEPAADRSLGHYLLVERLGSGHSGVVWKAWDTQLQRWVAVKEAREDVPFARERFLREARAAAKIRHPHLIDALEVGPNYLVMTYVEGRPLDQVQLPIRRAVTVMVDIADAVAALHGVGVLHRDLKPQNILLDPTGHARLGDFGIARDLAARPLTIEGTLLGTPVYMAPEQAAGQPEQIREPADVYGLGATLYHLLTGRAPYLAGDDLRTLLRRLSDEKPVPPRQINLEVPPDLEAIVLKCLEKHPDDRYKSAAALSDDLRRYLHGDAPAARRSGRIGRTARYMARQPRRLVLPALLLLLGFAIFAGFRQERYLSAFQEGVELWSRGAALPALDQFEAAILADASRPEPWLFKGRCLLRLYRYEEAQAAWTEALTRDPGMGAAHLERGRAALSAYVQRRPSPILRSSGGRIRFGTPEPEKPAERALREQGERDLAAARNAKGLDAAELHALAGLLLYTQGRYQDAAEGLAESADPAGLTLHAAACRLSGNFAGAERSLTLSLSLEPRPERYRARGDARLALGQAALAAEDYARAGEDPHAICGRGLALQAMGRPGDAIVEYSRAIAAKPAFARAYNNRGAAKAEIGDLAGARKDFEAALERNEFYADAYQNLGNVLLLQEQPAEAERLYGLALGADAAHVDARVHRARARMKLGRIAEALEDLEAAAKLDPTSPEVLADLAGGLHIQGEGPRAQATLRKALELAPLDWPRRTRAQQLLEEWSR